MLRGMSNNTTSGGGFSIPSVISSPAVQGTPMGIYYGESPILYDKDVKARRVNIVSPYLYFKTEREAVRAFRGMLRILARRGFPWVMDFDGPRLGITKTRDELVPVQEVLDALTDMDDRDVNDLLGMKVVLVHELDDRVTAKVKVREGGRTKVKVRIKGTILKASWNRIRGDVKRKFHVNV